MKDKFLRVVAITGSILLLASSVGMIIWMSRNESGRLGERERLAREVAEQTLRQESQSANQSGESPAETSKKLLHDVDTLLSGITQDDLPLEE